MLIIKATMILVVISSSIIESFSLKSTEPWVHSDVIQTTQRLRLIIPRIIIQRNNNNNRQHTHITGMSYHIVIIFMFDNNEPLVQL